MSDIEERLRKAETEIAVIKSSLNQGTKGVAFFLERIAPWVFTAGMAAAYFIKG